MRAIADLVAPMPSAEERWAARVGDFLRLVQEGSPGGSTILVASRGDEELLKFDGRTGWHFPRTESGEPVGFHPADSAEAIAHVQELGSLGATHVAFPSTELWWLDHYRELTDHLQSAGRRAASSDAGVVYSLR